MSILQSFLDDTDTKQAQEYFDLGNQAVANEDWENAIAFLCESIDQKPDFAEAYHNLGYIFYKKEKFDEAEALFRKALEFNPSLINAYYNLGFIYQKKKSWQDAEFCFRRVLALDPYSANVYNNLAVLLENVYRFDEAEKCYRQAIQIDPEYACAYCNLGKLLRITKRLQEAEKCLVQANKLSPNNDKFIMALAFFYLYVGQFEKGWKWFGVVEQNKLTNCPQFNSAHWIADNLPNLKVLLYMGKGLGDSIQFVRYVEKVISLVPKTVVLVQKPLHRLIAANYSHVKVYEKETALKYDYDYACSLQNLPILFNTVESTIPCRSAYLSAVPEDVEIWKEFFQALSGSTKYRVGIVWAGNPDNPMDFFRSIPFSAFSQLLKIRNVDWFSLQVGRHAEDCQNNIDIVDLSPRLTDFAQTAAAIHNLDLVISMDTSVAHLAGAMGKKTWVLLDINSDWRWQLDRTDSPWYSSMRLFRQKEAGDWVEVLDRVADLISRIWH